MSNLLSFLKAAAGQIQLSSAFGRWAQQVTVIANRLNVGWFGHAVCSATVTIAFPNVGPSPTYSAVAKPDCTVNATFVGLTDIGGGVLQLDWRFDVPLASELRITPAAAINLFGALGPLDPLVPIPPIIIDTTDPFLFRIVVPANGGFVPPPGSPSLVFDLHSVIWQKVL